MMDVEVRLPKHRRHRVPGIGIVKKKDAILFEVRISVFSP